MTLPITLGVEGAGFVSAIGGAVAERRVGERVAWKWAVGSYAEQVLVPADQAVPVPDGVSDDVAASILMQGLTASSLATVAYPVKDGDVALIHAAAGGVGLLLTQIVRLRGGRVIATVSSAAKSGAVLAAGADSVIVLSETDFVSEVRRLTGGVGVSVVFDGVGLPTFEGSMAALRPGGTLAYFGQAGGAVPPVDLWQLLRSINVTHPVLHDLVATRAQLLKGANELFDWVISGRLHVTIGGRYPLEQAARAHEELENRHSVGKLLLIP
jgi:NADPH2:quinone reductase